MKSMYKLYMEVYSGDILAYAKCFDFYSTMALFNCFNTELAMVHEIFTELNKAGSYKESPYDLTVCLYTRPKEQFNDDRLSNVFRLYLRKKYSCCGEKLDFSDGLNIF